KYAVVAGAVTGGGLTVIANAPNPAGQSILSKFFPGGVNPAKLLIGALIPTIILGLLFMGIPQDLKDPKNLNNSIAEATE
ncbi:MAG TPA: putative Na+/H+ antiporter, partial [SAR324 cluster bacterium]|nr:putative Na+/H+ antiporter [SAR324 cluster bacterium]